MKSKNTTTNSLDLHVELPRLPDVEKVIIGTMLVSFNEAERFIEPLSEEDFTEKASKAVFVAVRVLQAANKPISQLTVATQLTEMKSWDEVGGAGYLSEVTQEIGAGANLEYFVKVLRQNTLVRRVLTSSATIIEDSKKASLNVDEFVDRAMSLMEYACAREEPSAETHIGPVLQECVNEMDSIRQSGVIPGVPTGYPSLDRLLGGWKPGDFAIIAARPSVGKHSFLSRCRTPITVGGS